MPIYEYRCRACGDTREELRPVSDADAPVDCACGTADVTRLPSLIARGAGDASLPMAGGEGGCCGGGGCGCGH
jgi:putative FmdB family regulatory protein